MRFLKDMIAKKASLAEAEYYADPDVDEADHLGWADADDDASFADELMPTEAPVRPEASMPVASAPIQSDALLPDLPPDDPEEPDQDDMDVKIWEMFNEEDDQDEDEDKPDIPDVPVAEDDGDSTGDLAREALKSMIGAPPVVEKSSPPVPTAPKASPAAQDAQPAARAGRVKTRMLGFHSPEKVVPQVFDRAKTKDNSAEGRFPVGWLVLIEGPGRGTSFPLHCGVSTIGRGTDQKVCLDFGDNSISRDSHAVLAYDDDSNAFYVGHTGKANLVRLNGRPVLATEEIANFDLIRIGETTLRFVGFCGPEFAWDMTDDEEIAHAQAS